MRFVGLVALVGALFVACLVWWSSAPAMPPPPPLASPPGQCSKFAAEHGSDSWPGTWRRPFRNAGRLLESLRPGQVGCLRSGTFAATSTYLLDVRRSNVTIRSYPGERALLRGRVWIRRGADNVRLAHVSVEGTGVGNTIEVYGARFVLEGSNITNVARGRSCMILGDVSAGQAVRPTIVRNVFYECGSPSNGNKDHAIYAAQVVEAKITDNVFWATAGYAVHLYPNSQRTTVAHNVIDGGPPTVRGGIVFGGDSSSTSNGNVVERNIVTNSETHNIESSWDESVGTGNIARLNCVFGGRSGDVAPENGFTAVENISADPLYVDRTRHDYRLRPGSPCLSVVGYDTAARVLGR